MPVGALGTVLAGDLNTAVTGCVQVWKDGRVKVAIGWKNCLTDVFLRLLCIFLLNLCFYDTENAII